MVSDEEMLKETNKLKEDYTGSEWSITNILLKAIRKGIELGKKEGIQRERKRVREQVKIVGGLTHKLKIEDIDIWDD